MLTPFSTAPSKDLWQVGTSLFWTGLWIFALGMLTSLFVLRWWPGDRLLIVRLINYATPWFLLLLIPALVLSGWAQHKWLALTLSLPTAFIILAYLPLFLPRACQELSDVPHLKVMSYNIWSHNRNMAEVARIIEEQEPDILLLQEIKAEKLQELVPMLSNVFPAGEETFTYLRGALLATFSRYPLTALPVETQGSIQKTRIVTPQGTLTAFNTHFLRTVLRYRSNWLGRHTQIETFLADDITMTRGPVILGGDFNLTDQTETYRMICQNLKNAHAEAGWGFGFTFPSSSRKLKRTVPLPPMVRIDHLFYNAGLQAKRAGTLEESGGSDHLPIVAEFSFSPE